MTNKKTKKFAKKSPLKAKVLKRLLRNCGIGAAVIAAILLALKTMPLVLALLAVLGLWAALRLLARLAWPGQPYPAC